MPILSRKGLQLPVIMSASVFLSGCVLPEHLDVGISMKGYHYEVAIEGRLAEPRMIGALSKRQTLPANHDEKMRSEEGGALELPGMKRFAYVGEGRYEFAMRVTGKLTWNKRGVGFPDARGTNANFLTIRREPDGTVLISSPKIPENALADLSAIGLAASGKISIEVDGQILESTADEKPVRGPHVWNRTNWEDHVYFKFVPAPDR